MLTPAVCHSEIDTYSSGSWEAFSHVQAAVASQAVSDTQEVITAETPKRGSLRSPRSIIIDENDERHAS